MPNKATSNCHLCGRHVVSYISATKHVIMIGIPADYKESAFWCSKCESILCPVCAGGNPLKATDVHTDTGTTRGGPNGLCPVCGRGLQLANDTQLAVVPSKALENLKHTRDEDKKRQATERRLREEEQRKQAEERRLKGEEQQRITAARKSSGLCIMCGKEMSVMTRIFGRKSHAECKQFLL
jgi:hypothetical protein